MPDLTADRDKFLIDANLPYYFSIGSGDNYQHVIDINDSMPDSEIWSYAKEHHLTIVTKDSDFSDMILLNQPPPRVIHIKFGNMKMKAFYQHMSLFWDDIIHLSHSYKLVQVYKDRLEGID